jgi:hypothetical protein
LNYTLKIYRQLVQAAFVLACLFAAVTSSCAEDNARAATEKWRPKDGRYANPGKDFIADCGESGYMSLELSKKQVGGNEWSCDITKITDTAAGAISA